MIIKHQEQQFAYKKPSTSISKRIAIRSFVEELSLCGVTVITYTDI